MHQDGQKYPFRIGTLIVCPRIVQLMIQLIIASNGFVQAKRLDWIVWSSTTSTSLVSLLRSTGEPWKPGQLE